MSSTNPFDQFDESTATGTAQPNPFDIFDSRQEQSKVGTGAAIQDFAIQTLHGLGRGIAAIPGFGGDVSNLLGAGINWAGNRIAPETNAAIKSAISGVPNVLPSSADTMGFAERNLIGQRPEPQTATGRFAGNVAQYIPGSMIPFGGPTTALGLLGKAGMGALSGAASEGAAAVGLPPAAQVAAGLLPAAGAMGLSALRGGPAAGLVRKATSELTPEDWARAQQLQKTGQEVGIPLLGSETLAPKVGPGAIGQLASDVKASAQGGPIINPVFENRPDKIKQVAKEAIAKIGPDATANDILVNTRDVAAKAIAQAKQQRTQVTSPLYQAAGKLDIPEESVSPIIGQIDSAIESAGKNTSLRSALNKLRGQLVTDSGVETRTSRLQNVYQELRDSLSDPSIVEGSLRKQVGTLAPINKQIRDALVTNNPVYATADDLFKKMSEPVVALEGTADNPGLMSRVASAKDNAQLRSLLLDPENVSPDTVSTVASIFRSQNRDRDFAAWVRHYLENSLDKSSKDLQSGQNPALGANWRNLIGGAPNQRAVLDAYLNEVDQTGGAARGFNRLTQVLERTAKTPGTGSPTAQRLQLSEELSSGFAPSAAGIAAAGGLAAVGGPGLSGAGYVGGTWINKFIRQQAVKMGSERIAKALTDPDAVGKLRALARKDPASPQAAAAVAAILGGRAKNE